MSILDQAKPAAPEPLVITICGTPGTGKTSLAATFPGPCYLIQTLGEKAPRDLPEDQRPVSIGETSTADALWEQLAALAKGGHPYQTVIIDSVTGLDVLFVDGVLKSDPKAKGIQQALGGYGAGREAVATRHARVRRAAEVLRKRGMNVVFVAHSDVTRIDPPDGEGFNQYSLRMHQKSMASYVDNVDVVGFIRQATVVIGDETQRRAVTTGERVLVTYLTPIAITKNRVGIVDDLTLERGVNPFAPWMAGAPNETPSTRVRLPLDRAKAACVTEEDIEAAIEAVEEEEAQS